jgi:hypothetical protein
MSVYYIARTPRNPEFAGKVYGIQFNAGKAIISKETITEHLGLTADEVAARMKADFDYEIEKIGSETPATVPVETGGPPAHGAEVAKKTRKG